MIRPTSPNAERYRIHGKRGENYGAFTIPSIKPSFAIKPHPLHVIVSEGLGWDHVSISTDYRIPIWEEMEMIKRLFFKESEWAMQLHAPPKSHINSHPFCLHIWRPQTEEEMEQIKREWINSGEEMPPDWMNAHSPGSIPIPPKFCV